MAAKATVVLLPVWASGHFMPALEAGKRLVATLGPANFSLTVLLMHPPTPVSASQVAAHVAREAANPSCGGCEVSFHRLPAVDPPTGCDTVEVFTSCYIHLHAPHVRATVAALPAAALVVEFTSTTMLDIARDLGVPAYVFFASSAAMLALMLRLPALSDENEMTEQGQQHVHVPGLPPVPASCMPVSMMGNKSPSYEDLVYHGASLTEAAGIIVSTAAELELDVLAAIADGRCTERSAPPLVYPIGPVIPFLAADSSSSTSDDHECLRWLDAQPRGSVVFLCFGSLGFLTDEQVREAAAGLERSGRRFLWALRRAPPPATGESETLVLSEGFVEGTKGRGLVWTSWAPQREVLAHHAVGGFVTHCGWNSVLEALWSGVPIV